MSNYGQADAAPFQSLKYRAGNKPPPPCVSLPRTTLRLARSCRACRRCRVAGPPVLREGGSAEQGARIMPLALPRIPYLLSLPVQPGSRSPGSGDWIWRTASDGQQQHRGGANAIAAFRRLTPCASMQGDLYACIHACFARNE